MARLDEEKEYFDKLSSDVTTLSHLFIFLCCNKRMFNLLSAQTRDIIVSYRNRDFEEKDEFFALKLATTFLFNSVTDYFNDIKNRVSNREIKLIDPEYFGFIARIYEDIDCENDLIAVLLEYASTSINFYEGDERMSLIMENFLHRLSRENVDKLIEIVTSNSQLSGRRKAARDMVKLQSRLHELSI